MSDHSTGNFENLKGKRLLGYMPIPDSRQGMASANPNPLKINGDWDNAIVLFIGKAEKPEAWVVRSQNGDYSCYDSWVIEQLPAVPDRDSSYKAIGEEIKSVADNSEKKEIQDRWTDGTDVYWLEIKTKTKTLRLGHHWNDCHYPNSIWDVL